MSKMQDHTIGKLIGLSRMMEEKAYRSQTAEAIIAEGLVAVWKADEAHMTEVLKTVEEEMEKASPDCVACKACWPGNYNYDMDFVREAEAPIRKRKEDLLQLIQRFARDRYTGITEGDWDGAMVQKMEKALKVIGNNVITAEELDAVTREMEI